MSLYMERQSEPVALVGSGCRFAGGATTPSKLWDLLVEPRDLAKVVPPDRFSARGFYHPDGEYHGTTNSIKAYWLEQDFRVFDAAFFNITPKEAEAMDPQQRMLLEVVYESLESAGFTMQQYAGQKVSVFSGLMTADYDHLSQRDELTASQYYATGNGRSILSNRLSYFFDWRGPSMTIDTACSSSLVALHQAILSLRAGECTMACVAGANLMLSPDQFIVESNLRMLSPTGHSRMWDADADGYARGEGIAAVLLKPLSKALADGDAIQAIIRETGVNSDGRTRGITLPSSEAQAALIRETYHRAGLDLTSPQDRCQYFEAHGTGTQAGDPHEAAAIQDAFFGDVAQDQVRSTETTDSHNGDPRQVTQLLVGSVKTVIGHTEGAAGLAGVLKVVQAMQHSLVPPNMHLKSLNPSVQPFCAGLHVPTEAIPWPLTLPGHPLRASVNSFGFGGTNAHAIIERYEPRIHDGLARQIMEPEFTALRKCAMPQVEPIMGERRLTLPLLFSAKSPKSLLGLIKKYRDSIQQSSHTESDIQGLAWSLFHQRTVFPYRLSIAGSTRLDILRQLDSLLHRYWHAPTIETVPRGRQSTAKPRILGILTGQGAQWATMSKDLLQGNSIYRDTIRTLDAALQQCPHPPEWTLEQEILASAGTSRVSIAAISQPLCTALQIALIDLLRSLGVDLHCVIGHSSGEIAAAYAAHRLSARDAILIAYYRGRGAHSGTGRHGEKGGMMAVNITRIEAEDLCSQTGLRGKLCVAASNAPSSVTLSGDIDALDTIQERLAAEGKFLRRLFVGSAYHSHHMQTPACEYEAMLAALEIKTLDGNNTLWVSTLNPEVSTSTLKSLGVQYWAENMLHPVLFKEAIVRALDVCEPFDFTVEIGPHPVMRGPTLQTIKDTTDEVIPYIGMLDRTQGDSAAFAELIGFLWTRFGPSSLDHLTETTRFASPTPPRLHRLQLYEWDHSQIHHRESRISRQYQARKDPPHELLGVRTRDDTDHELRWRNVLRLSKLPWIEGHQFQGQALLPASAYCLMAFDAARAILHTRDASVIELQDLEFLSGIVLEPDNEGIETLFTLKIEQQNTSHSDEESILASISLSQAPADGTAPMRKSLAGKVRITLSAPNVRVLPGRSAAQPETLPVSNEAFYQAMSDTGLKYSGPFRSLSSLERRAGFATRLVKRHHEADTTTLSISPAMLDNCLQASFVTFSSPGDKALWAPFLPVSIARVRFNVAALGVSHPTRDILVDAYQTHFTSATTETAASITGDVHIYSNNSVQEIQVEGLTVGSFAPTLPEDDYELYLHTAMQPDPEDEIASMASKQSFSADRYFHESCDRVVSFCRLQHKGRDTIPVVMAAEAASLEPFLMHKETEESLEKFMLGSPFYPTLKMIQDAFRTVTNDALDMLPILKYEGMQLCAFQKNLSAIVGQISHKYPCVSVLTLTNAELALNEHILGGLRRSCFKYTAGGPVELNLRQRVDNSDGFDKRFKSVALKLDEDLQSQLNLAAKFDLVVVSTALLENHSTLSVLKQIRQMTKPGGFLILAHATGYPLREGLRQRGGSKIDLTGMLTPPEWPDILEQAGFVDSVHNSYQSCSSRLSLIVRQARCPSKELLQNPLSGIQSAAQSKHVLAVGGEPTMEICSQLDEKLKGFCGNISFATSFTDTDTAVLAGCTAVIILVDLDAPFLSNMTQTHLEALRSLMRPEMIILWVTQGATDSNPDSASIFGFTRSIRAETPGLILQILDLDDLTNAAHHIAESFARLLREKDTNEEMLWTRETEVHIREGKRLVPRVIPCAEANDRVNSCRRVITKLVNTLEHSVSVKKMRFIDGLQRYQASISSPGNTVRSNGDGHSIQVNYSSVAAFDISGQSYHVCIGRDSLSTTAVVCVSIINASAILVPDPFARALPEVNTAEALFFISILTRALQCFTIVYRHRSKHVVLLQPDPMLLYCAEDILTAKGVIFQAYKITGEMMKTMRIEHIHPQASVRELRRLFWRRDMVVYDYCQGLDQLSNNVVQSLPDGCDYHQVRVQDGHEPSLQNSDDVAYIAAIFDKAVEYTLSKAKNMDAATTLLSFADKSMTAPDLLNSPGPIAPFTVLDWKTERVVPVQISYAAIQQALRPDKTYVLVGITKDFGQSLCSLFVEQGARNIVLASRSPNKSPNWAQELCKFGATIRIESLDVTRLDDVRRFKAVLAQTMPPVAGVVNGAMVLDDRVFSQMTAEIWHRVMQPKTVGSKNLDVVFDDPNLEFFIMTSSFAAIGGHAGQSNYAAANMYMNGLAADRRRRGLAGSVLNIGVIYGVGFLHREKGDLYDGLEREGYPPTSERDIHHMFLEAIVAGKPVPGQITDLMTGLRRYRPHDPFPLHWHSDPRFMHFTVDEGDNALRNSACVGHAVKGDTISQVVKGATNVSQIVQILLPAFAERLEFMLRLSSGTALPESSFSELGIDSLVAVEIRSWIWKTLGVDAAVMKILGSPSILALCSDLAAQLMPADIDDREHRSTKLSGY